MGDSIIYCEQCENCVGCHLARKCFHANDKAQGPLDAAACSDGLDFETWETLGGDTDGISRTVCHSCERMYPVEAMTEDDRFDNICPHCIADRQSAKDQA
jgi:hypothetical protein